LCQFLKVRIKKKNYFFHEKINLVSEIILFSIDVKVNKNHFEKEGYYFKRILFKTNLLKTHILGSGCNTNIIFGILCQLWVHYIKKNLSISIKKRLLIVISSKEEREQLILSISHITALFSIDFLDCRKKSSFILIDKNFLVTLISDSIFSLMMNPQFLNLYGCVFIKGDYFIPHYHLSLVKFKNFNSLKSKSLQKILLFNRKIYRNRFFEKEIFSINTNSELFYEVSYFPHNQIIDISGNQSWKIHRLVKVCNNFNRSKIIISNSWGRCLLFCELVIKSIIKSKGEYKTFKIVKINEKICAIFDLDFCAQYYTCCISKKKELKVHNCIILFDICQEESFFLNFSKFLRIFKLINLSIHFLLELNKTWFFKIIKAIYSEHKNV